MKTQDEEKEKLLISEESEMSGILTPNWPTGLLISPKKDIRVSVTDDLEVVITQSAFEQLFGWAYSTNREISCLGSVKRDGHRFLIENLYLLKQSGSSVETELDQTAMAELIEQLIAQGKHEETRRIKCWVHSHPNMETFWSNTDNHTCRLLVNDYLISIVVGGNFNLRCRIDIASPIPIVLDCIPVVYQISKDMELLERCAEEVKNTVSAKDIVPHKRIRQRVITDDMLQREYYCEYCGTSHLEGECPLDNPENWPESMDDEFF